jgi:hypothetical protein
MFLGGFGKRLLGELTRSRLLAAASPSSACIAPYR